MKKLLLIIALTIFGLGLNAQSVTIDYGDYSLEFYGDYYGECYVSGYSGTPVDVTIPSTVEISGNDFSITSIGGYAFSECSSLTSVTFGENSQLTYIGYDAFSECSSLTSIEIPNSVTSIGEMAFYYCSSLTSIVVAEGNTVYDSRGNCNAIIETSSNTLIAGCQNTVIPNSVTSIGSSAFSGCESLTSIEIPNSVTSIGNEAFSYCSSLTSIEIPNSVTSIGFGAFGGCSSLTSIEIPNSVTSIGSSAFSGCESLTSIEIPNSVTSIGNEAFYYCKSLTNIEIPNSVTSIGDYAFFSCSSLTSIEIPNSVTSIGYWAFSCCSSLRFIRCHAAEVPTTGEMPLGECYSIQNIQVPEASVDDYKAASYWNEYNITKIYPYFIGEELVVDYDGYSLKYTAMEDYRCSVTCYAQPSKPTSITIPTTVTFGETELEVASIGERAFSYCESLTSIEIPNSVTSIGYEAFSGCSRLKNIEIPNSVTSIGEWAFVGCSSLTSIEIPNSVTSIGEGAFSSCYSLTSIEIPNSVTSIGNEAFSYCSSLTSIEIPNFVTSIGKGTFSGCSSLTSIEIPNSVTSIGESAFEFCYSLTSIEIPNSVTSIGWYAFSDCSSLEVIKCYAEDVPETGEDAFDDCPSDMIIYVPEVSLEYYKATSPWNEFTILSLNEGPRNITATTESVSSVNLSWDNCYADSYNVYRNGDSIIANVTNPTYTDICLEYNTEYCYTVTAVRNETESGKSEEACAKTLGESIEELSSSINIYPNPVDNELFLATEVRVKEVSIYDIYGRQTMSQQVNETTSQQVVEVADLEAGVYFVKVVTNEGEIVKRFVKK